MYYKKILNATLAKLGQNAIKHNNVEYIRNIDKLDSALRKKTLVDFRLINADVGELVTRKIAPKINRANNVAIAAYITAAARIYMFKACDAVRDIGLLLYTGK